MEKWLEIWDYPDYLISNEGSVFSKRIQRNLKSWSAGAGYQMVSLHNEFGHSKFYVHRLVVLTFMDVEEPFEVNHIDGDKTHNSLRNLEVLTHSDNLNHAYRTKLHSSGRAVRVVETGEEFYSISECSRALGVPAHHIQSHLIGRKVRRFQYTFELVDERR